MTTQAGAASFGGRPGPSLWSGEPASRLKRIMVWEKHTVRVQIEKWMACVTERERYEPLAFSSALKGARRQLVSHL